jgi:hypothetical protein
MKKTELEFRQELAERAQKYFGGARAAELRLDIDQLAAELQEIADFEMSADDEP